MPSDTEFTHSLFDNTALTGWTHHAPPILSGSYEVDPDDDDVIDDDTPSDPAE